MGKLYDTIARLAAQRAQDVPHGDVLTPDRLLDLPSFGSNPGALRSRYYLPENLPEGAPLVVVLHGCTQNAARYDRGSGWSQLADQAGFALLFPEQQRSNNPNLCFNWFLPADMRRGSGEALSIYQMIEAVVSIHGFDRRRIFVTGLSAGGAMALVMLATYPEVFAGGAIIAGLPYGSANTVQEAFDRMRGNGGPSERDLQRRLRGASQYQGTWPTLSIWQGSADLTVAPSNADAVVGQWRDVHKLGKSPTRSEMVDGQNRRVWCDASGTEVIEAYTIDGMGHGTALKTRGDDGLGATAPFMLDVGISSTRHIANFWGIASSGRPAAGKLRQKKPEASQSAQRSHDRATTETAAQSSRPKRKSDSNAVRKIIEHAMRSAGLMR